MVYSPEHIRIKVILLSDSQNDCFEVSFQFVRIFPQAPILSLGFADLFPEPLHLISYHILLF